MSIGAEFSPELKAAIREFIVAEGSPVEFQEPWYEGDTTHHVSPYSWRDWAAEDHASATSWREAPCHWLVPEGSFLYEESFSCFQDTGSDNVDRSGINVSGCRCACGKYTDVTLRWEGTLGQLINKLAPKEPTKKGWTL